MSLQSITPLEVQQTTLITPKAKRWAMDNLDYLNKPMKLFGSSMKVEKGADKFNTYILYLQPADKVSTKTLCLFADKAGCKKPCLIDSGQLGMSIGQNAATKRTILMLLRPQWFDNQLLLEIDKAERKAAKDKVPALFRLNGTSDIDFTRIIEQRPSSLFYDYTKILTRVRKNTLANYDLTFSGSMFSDQSRQALRKAVERNHRIAIAFNTKDTARDELKMPEGFMSFDKTDLRHLDGVGIGTLKRKGSSISERTAENNQEYSFFVTKANVRQFNDLINVTEVV
tara:strand:- start:44 stop:895 length:852 start_codon:yes stop_codon:yes gene_type:complete